MRSLHGIYLLEVLISLLLISIALLGIDATLLTSMQSIKKTDYYLIASQQLENICERLSLSPRNVEQILQQWNMQNKQVLPLGRGIIKGGEVSIFWGHVMNANCEHNEIGESGCLKRTINLRDLC